MASADADAPAEGILRAGGGIRQSYRKPQTVETVELRCQRVMRSGGCRCDLNLE